MRIAHFSCMKGSGHSASRRVRERRASSRRTHRRAKRHFLPCAAGKVCAARRRNDGGWKHAVPIRAIRNDDFSHSRRMTVKTHDKVREMTRFNTASAWSAGLRSRTATSAPTRAKVCHVAVAPEPRPSHRGRLTLRCRKPTLAPASPKTCLRLFHIPNTLPVAPSSSRSACSGSSRSRRWVCWAGRL